MTIQVQFSLAGEDDQRLMALLALPMHTLRRGHPQA